MQITSLYDQIRYDEQRPALTVMIDNEHTKEIRIVFKKGQEMKEHKTKFPIVIEIVEGQIDFGVDGQRHSLHKGSLITLEGGVPHDLRADDDSVVRLSLSKFDQASRVAQVVNS